MALPHMFFTRPYTGAILCLFIACSKDPRPTLLSELRHDLQPTGIMTGTVKGPEGQPLSATNVVIKESGQSATSTSDGGYTVRGLAVGTYSLVFMRYGFMDTTITGIVLDTSDKFVHPVILRRSLATVTGRVVSQTQPQGVPDAVVAVPGYPFSARTAMDGSFRLAEVPPGDNRIIAAATEGWGQSYVSLVPGDFQNLSISLSSEGGSITGTVYTKNDLPDSGAIVSNNDAFVDTATNGSYHLSGVPTTVPLIIDAGVDQKISNVLVPDGDTVQGIDIFALGRITRDSFSIVDRQVYALEGEPVPVFADVRKSGAKHISFAGISFFLWDTCDAAAPGDESNPYETITSDPVITLSPVRNDKCAYGVVTVDGDTISGAVIQVIQRKAYHDITFTDASFAPVEGTTVNGDSVTLLWHAVDHDGRPLQYAVFFGDLYTDPPGLYRDTIYVDSMRVSPQGGWEPGRYHWQVMAIAGNDTIKSDTRSFLYQ